LALEHPSSSSVPKLNRQRIHITKQPTKRNMGLSVVVCIQLPASAKQTRLLYSPSDGGDGNRCSTRPLGNESSRDADLARPLASPDGPSSAGCRQRWTLTTSDRSAKRRTPTRLMLYRRSSQVVRYDGLVKPPPTVCAARCTATLDPGSDKLNMTCN
jgi:hypothetical protein